MSALRPLLRAPLARRALRPTAATAPAAPAPAPARSTTVLAVRRDDTVTVVGDGQVTQGSTVVKSNARKVRRLGAEQRVIAGFAGATADALTLIDRLEGKIDEFPDQLLRACVHLAKDWRMDKYLRRLDASLLVCDRSISLYVTGNGDVLETPDGIIAIGSGSPYAIAAARALAASTDLSAAEIAQRSLAIAADLDIYTNDGVVEESIQAEHVSETNGDDDKKQAS